MVSVSTPLFQLRFLRERMERMRQDVHTMKSQADTHHDHDHGSTPQWSAGLAGSVLCHIGVNKSLSPVRSREEEGVATAVSVNTVNISLIPSNTSDMSGIGPSTGRPLPSPHSRADIGLSPQEEHYVKTSAVSVRRQSPVRIAAPDYSPYSPSAAAGGPTRNSGGGGGGGGGSGDVSSHRRGRRLVNALYGRRLTQPISLQIMSQQVADEDDAADYGADYGTSELNSY